MTFNNLFSQYQLEHGSTHDIIFFELVFYLSKQVKNKEQFISNRNNEIDFKPRKFAKLCKDYYIKQKPLAHIVGQTTFCDLKFQINKKVLAPRDVTEQMTWNFIQEHKNDPAANVVDLCCGSGCIGISIKKYIPQFNVVCIDKYWGPILNTRANGIKHKTPLIVDQKDVVDYLNHRNSIDYLISNPPYIDPNNFSNVKMFKWENKKALIAKDNGLYFYKKYLEWLNNHTFKEAWFEVGYDLIQPLKEIANKYPELNIIFNPNHQYIIVKRKY